MSEGTTEATATEETAASKRKTLTLGERIKIIDFLRGQVEPIAADSNAAVAAIVSDKTGVEIDWQRLKYMIDDETLAEWKLGSKIYVKSMLSVEDQLQACYERDISFEAKLAKLEDRILHIEANLQVNQ